MNIPYKAAAQAIERAHNAWNSETEPPFTVTVMDTGRNMVAFARLDGALLVSMECSIGKAYTSVSLAAPSDALLPMIVPGQPLYGLETTQSRPMVMFKGGMPVFVQGKLVGAVGVSGGPVETDERIAKMIADEIANSMNSGG